MHITRYKDARRRKVLQNSVQELVNWMGETQVEPVLTEMVSKYLMAQDEVTTRSCLSMDVPEYIELAEVTGHLKWG